MAKKGYGRSDKDTSTLCELRESLNELKGIYSREYDRAREDLLFESGDHWRGTSRAKTRVTLTLNLTRSYVDRIVNPYILNPVSIKIDLNKNDPHRAIVKEFIDKDQDDSNATEAYQTAFRNAVTCGRGFIHVGTTYANDTSLDQRISIDAINDPLSCYLGPHNNINGSDAKYGVYIRYIDEKSAISRYGEDVIFDTLGVYDTWGNTEGQVASVLFYNIIEKQIKRQFMPDGRYLDTDTPIEETTQTRYITKKTLECHHIIGEKIISTTKYDMPYVPIVPVYGDRVFTEHGIEYAGIPYKTRGVNTQINYSASSEAELIALAPKAPWIATAKQVAKNKQMWRNSNTVTYDTLIYEPETVEGHLVGAPQRADNTAQTQGIAQSKSGSMHDMSKVTGMFDDMFGNNPNNTAVSGVAHKSMASMGELSTAQYADNLNQSIEQLGIIWLYLANNVYDTPKTITVKDQQVEVAFTELGINPESFGVDVYTGPSVESKKQESITSLTEMMQYSPESAPLLAVRIAENMNIPNRDGLVADLKKVLPPNLQDNEDQEMPPEAQQALQSAQQAVQSLEALVEEYESVVANMQTQLISDEADRASDIEMKRIDSLTKLSVEKIKSYTDLQKEAMKNNTEAPTEGVDVIVDDAMTTINQETNTELEEVAESIGGIVQEGNIDPMDQTQKVGGPVDAMGPIGDEDSVENIEDILLDDNI